MLIYLHILFITKELSIINYIIITPGNYLYVLGNLFEVVEAMKEKIDYMQQNTITLSVLGGREINRCIQNLELGDVVNRIFKCMICHSLSSGPVCIGNCCKQVLGCADCLEQWFINNKLCRHCLANNGNVGTNKVLTTAFDKLLKKTRSLFDVA